MPELNNDLRLRAVVLAVAAVLVMLVVVGTAIGGFWRSALPGRSSEAPNSRLDFRRDTLSLQSAPQPDRARYEADKQRALDSWGWVDQRAGIAHIPVGQAMQILAAGGNSTAAAGSARGAQAAQRAADVARAQPRGRRP